MPVDSTSLTDAGNIQESKLSKGTCGMPVKTPNIPEKRAHFSENGHHESQGQSAENIKPSDPGLSTPLLENGRTNIHGKKAKDLKDLAQRLLFSETKSSSSTGRHNHESKIQYETENCSPHKKTSENGPKLKFKEDTLATVSNGSMNRSKDYILFSPTRMAAAKKRSGFQQQKPKQGNLSVSVLTPPPGLDLSSLCSSPTDAGRVILHSAPLNTMKQEKSLTKSNFYTIFPEMFGIYCTDSEILLI